VDPTARGVDPGHRGAGLHDHAEVQAAREQRVGERAQPAAQVPAAEGQLGVGDGDQRGRGPARVGAGVGGVPVEQHPQPRVGQVAPAQPAQRPAGADGRQVAQPPGQRRQVQRGVDAPAQDVPQERPDPAGRATAAASRRARSPNAAPIRAEDRRVGAVQAGPPPGRRVGRSGPGYQVEVFVSWRHRLEQVGEDLGQGEQARPGVEVERPGRRDVRVPAELAADGVGPFEDGHLVPRDGQPGGGGQPTHPGADDHNPRHAAPPS
jgi:hypothetical protein